jgi:hypothetical protein
MANLAPQTIEEAIEANIPSETLADLMMASLCRAHQFVVHSFFLEEGRPGAVMAVATHPKIGLEPELGLPTTFLIGAKGFFEASIKHRLQLREHMASLKDQFGPIYTKTYSAHSNMARWLRLMGYVRAEHGENLYRWG